MTRSVKLKKLGNAIREYRGAYHARSGRWIRTPRPDAAGRVLRWLTELNVAEPVVALADIQEFKTYVEMREWMRNLSENGKGAS